MLKTPGLAGISLALGIILLFSSAAQAQCVAPERPELPQAEVPSMEMMLAGQKAVKQFQSNNMRYMQCLEQAYARERAAEATQNRLTSSSAAQRRYDEAITAAVSAEAEVADAYDAALRRYHKARGQ